MSNQLKPMRLVGTTDASGDLVVTAPRALFGWLIAVQWIDGDLADGVDAVLKAVYTPSGVDTTLLTLTDANADAWYYPVTVENDNAGAALTTRTLQIIEGTLQLTVADGGDTKTGGCIVYYTDN
jgi:hypothetical protein